MGTNLRRGSDSRSSALPKITSTLAGMTARKSLATAHKLTCFLFWRAGGWRTRTMNWARSNLTRCRTRSASGWPLPSRDNSPTRGGEQMRSPSSGPWRTPSGPESLSTEYTGGCRLHLSCSFHLTSPGRSRWVLTVLTLYCTCNYFNERVFEIQFNFLFAYLE